VKRIRKFDEPVRVYIDNPSVPGRNAEILAAVSDIRAHVDHLDLAATEDRDAAAAFVFVTIGAAPPPAMATLFSAASAAKIAAAVAKIRVFVMLSSRLERAPKRMLHSARTQLRICAMIDHAAAKKCASSPASGMAINSPGLFRDGFWGACGPRQNSNQTLWLGFAT